LSVKFGMNGLDNSAASISSSVSM